MSVTCEIVDRLAQPTLSLRTRASVAELPGLMGQVYGAIMQYLGELGEFPAGPPFAAYYNMDTADLDVEIGFPLARPVPGRGDLLPGEMPGGRAAACLYIGPYDQVGPAYGELARFVEDNGCKTTGVAYEVYLNDPTVVPAHELQTQIVFPLKSDV